ncbi:MAG: phage tail sheath family protein [Vicinamibacterales bacterium]
MPTYNAPGVYVEEVPLGVQPIEGVSTSVAAFAGRALRGCTDAAVEVRSARDFIEEFGAIDGAGRLGPAVRQFFDNGGTRAWVVRLADEVDAASALASLDRVPPVNLLCVPGETTPAAIASLQAFCLARRIFLIADGPPTAAAPDGQLTGEAARNSAMYQPWIAAVDPVTGGTGTYPPCGFIAGVYARTDQTRGVWKAPAGLAATLAGATGVTTTLSEPEIRSLTDHGVNAIRKVTGPGTVVWGARTLAGGIGGASDWKYVSVRRFALYIEESISRSLDWAQFEPNAAPLWTRIALTVSAFLFGLFRQGAFVGPTPQASYFVKCDMETMTASDVGRGVINIVVGFAPLRPAEFVILRISVKGEPQAL